MEKYKKIAHPNRHLLRHSKDGCTFIINGREYPRARVSMIEVVKVKIGDTVETDMSPKQMEMAGYVKDNKPTPKKEDKDGISKL